MRATDHIVIVNGARTAMAEYSGTPGYGRLKDVSAIDLGAAAAKAALARSNVKPEDVHHVVFGNVAQTSSDAIYGARHIGLKAGVPKEVPAFTVNRLCGSGLQAIVNAAQLLLLEEARVVLAGGAENMSQAPLVIRGMRGEGWRFGTNPVLEDTLFQGLLDPYCGLFMAQTAEKLARQYSIPREAQDEFALRSHQLGAAAVQAGRFREEIVPVDVTSGRKTVVVDTDDHIKPETTLEALASLRPAFGKEGTVTAGNASGIVDSGASVVMMREDEARKRGLDFLGRVKAWSYVGVPPDVMGIGPAPAIRDVLKKCELELKDVDLFEINEAFAGQYLAVEKELGLDRDRVNVNGGAIAIGHPLGATGTRLALTLLLELRRRRQKRGIASACIGGGQGIAVVFERV
jgi:acetyl-CoA C-acetyltransferase/acetyl-CoA acyltransferase 2